MPAFGGHAFFPFQTGALVFVHLHCHSHYSFLRGVPSPEEIVAAAVEQKMPAVALTDTNGLYATVPFYKAALGAGIKPIVGVLLDVESPQNQKRFLDCGPIKTIVPPLGMTAARVCR